MTAEQADEAAADSSISNHRLEAWRANSGYGEILKPQNWAPVIYFLQQATPPSVPQMPPTGDARHLGETSSSSHYNVHTKQMTRPDRHSSAAEYTPMRNKWLPKGNHFKEKPISNSSGREPFRRNHEG